MYRIKENGTVIFDQLMVGDIVEKFDRGFLPDKIDVERLDTLTMVWNKVPLSQIFAR